MAVSHEIDNYSVVLNIHAGRRFLSTIINDPKHPFGTSIDHKAANFSANKIQTLSNPFKGEPRKTFNLICAIWERGRIETLPPLFSICFTRLDILISLTGWAPVHSFFDRFINLFRSDQGYGFELYSTTGVRQ